MLDLYAKSGHPGMLPESHLYAPDTVSGYMHLHSVMPDVTPISYLSSHLYWVQRVGQLRWFCTGMGGLQME